MRREPSAGQKKHEQKQTQACQIHQTRLLLLVACFSFLFKYFFFFFVASRQPILSQCLPKRSSCSSAVAHLCHATAFFNLLPVIDSIAHSGGCCCCCFCIGASTSCARRLWLPAAATAARRRNGFREGGASIQKHTFAAVGSRRAAVKRPVQSTIHRKDKSSVAQRSCQRL